MKTLILTIFMILFLAVMCSAQTSGTIVGDSLYLRAKVEPEWSIRFIEEEVTIGVGGEEYHTDLGVYQTMVLATILQQWESYEQECYADSTLDTLGGYWRFIKTGEFSGFGVITGYDEWIPEYVEWVHPKPTFNGFIEFLKKRIK